VQVFGTELETIHFLYPGTCSIVRDHLGKKWFNGACEDGQRQFFPPDIEDRIAECDHSSQLMAPWGWSWMNSYRLQLKGPVQTFPDREARRFTYNYSDADEMCEYAEMVRQYPDKTTARNDVNPFLGTPSFSYPSFRYREVLSFLCDTFWNASLS